MKSYEKEIQESFLNSEEKVLNKIENNYHHALKDIGIKVKDFQNQINELTPLISMAEGSEKEVLQSIQQSKIYQKQYQEALRTQIGSILDNMQVGTFRSIDDYLKQCYDDGFMGAMYSLHKQGVPLCLPLDQQAVVRSIQLDSKIKNGLYLHLGEDVGRLKNIISAQIARGISTGMSYSEIAQQIQGRMVGMYKNPGGALAYAMRIARTEGHRIQVQSAMDACYKAKDIGADVVKQWDSTLDKRTRKSHQHVDGELRELEEPFSNGLMFPGDPSGKAKEVINCRCALLQRARWALDDNELQILRQRASYYGLDKTENFDDFKSKYLKAIDDGGKILETPIIPTDPSYATLANRMGTSIEYNPVHDRSESWSDDVLISMLGGGDKTRGSCASVGLAYIGQKQGWNVLDFRDGFSRVFFARSGNLKTLSQANGLKTLLADGASSMTVANRLLKQVEKGKEYYLCVGKHASIVRQTEEGVLQYLELQSAKHSGWTDFDGNPRYTLKTRFGCSQSKSNSNETDFMIDINESNFNTDEFRSLLGYLNTDQPKQRKGASGSVK